MSILAGSAVLAAPVHAMLGLGLPFSAAAGLPHSHRGLLTLPQGLKDFRQQDTRMSTMSTMFRREDVCCFSWGRAPISGSPCLLLSEKAA